MDKWSDIQMALGRLRRTVASAENEAMDDHLAFVEAYKCILNDNNEFEPLRQAVFTDDVDHAIEAYGYVSCFADI